MMPEWAISVMFYGLVVFIIAALIAEFRGTSVSGDAAAADSLRNGDEPRLTSEDQILVDLASAAGLQDDRAEDP
jgi:hypothetical protein